LQTPHFIFLQKSKKSCREARKSLFYRGIGSSPPSVRPCLTQLSKRRVFSPNLNLGEEKAVFRLADPAR